MHISFMPGRSIVAKMSEFDTRLMGLSLSVNKDVSHLFCSLTVWQGPEPTAFTQKMCVHYLIM